VGFSLVTVLEKGVAGKAACGGRIFGDLPRRSLMEVYVKVVLGTL
jgi:hypothetical protein